MGWTSTFVKAKECSDCPSGKYGVLTDPDVTDQAPSLSSPTSYNTCEDCSPGRFRLFVINSMEGIGRPSASEICKVCPLGWATDAHGQSACLLCLPGFFCDKEGGQNCKECANNTYTNQKEQSQCKECEDAAHSAEGSAVCLKCEPGQYMKNAGTASRACTDCAAGQVSAYGKTECKECKKGQYTYVKNLNEAEECFSCPSGYYSKDVTVEDRINIDVCLKCPPGTYSAAQSVHARLAVPAFFMY